MGRQRARDYDIKRAQIRDAAAGLFAECGFHGSSIIVVAYHCGVTKPALYHYLPSRSGQVLRRRLRARTARAASRTAAATSTQKDSHHSSAAVVSTNPNSPTVEESRAPARVPAAVSAPAAATQATSGRGTTSSRTARP